MTFDDDLQSAIAASRADAGLPPQESGVTGTDQVYFGPANRSQNEYEQGTWEMVTMGKTSVQEILLDPEPADRKRDLNTPAFLKPSMEEHRLGALITIYHEIPMTREIFLNRSDVIGTYGHDPEWWSGKTIKLPGFDEQEEFRVDRELQRLMAFLDKTDRSYGSVEALVNIPSVKGHYTLPEKREAAVLEAWRNNPQNTSGKSTKIFSKAVPNEAAAEVPYEGHEFAILELALPVKDSYKETLYDIADDVLWSEIETTELSRSPYLSRVADVLVFKVHGNDFHKHIEIPAVWYPDRYLLRNREAAWKMRMDKQEVALRIERINATEERLTSFQTRNGKVIKVQDLLKAALKHDEAVINEDGSSPENSDTEVPIPRSGHSSTLSIKLQKVVASIDKKLVGKMIY